MRRLSLEESSASKDACSWVDFNAARLQRLEYLRYWLLVLKYIGQRSQKLIDLCLTRETLDLMSLYLLFLMVVAFLRMTELNRTSQMLRFEPTQKR